MTIKNRLTDKEISAILNIDTAIKALLDGDACGIVHTDPQDIYMMIGSNIYLEAVKDEALWKENKYGGNQEHLDYIRNDETLYCFKQCIKFNGFNRWIYLNYTNHAINNIAKIDSVNAIRDDVINQAAFILHNIYDLDGKGDSGTMQYAYFIRFMKSIMKAKDLNDDLGKAARARLAANVDSYTFAALYNKTMDGINSYIGNNFNLDVKHFYTKVNLI